MSSETEVDQVPATSLRCRICGAEHELAPLAVCPRDFGPLDPVYDFETLRKSVTRASLEQGPLSIWRYAALLPVEPPAHARLAPGFTPLIAAPRLASALGLEELHLKLDTANPTHSFKDRVVAVACAKAQELGLDTLACSSTGNLANAVAARAAAEGMEAAVFCPADLEPEKLVATSVYGATIYAVRGTYDDCSRLTVELSFEVPWGFVNVGLRAYYAEGSKTLGYEIAEQLGWELPDAVVAPIASGAMYSKVSRGFEDFRELGLVEGAQPRMYGAQAEGCSPVASAFAEGRRVTPVRPSSIARSLAIGNPADGELAVETARSTNGDIHVTPEDEIGVNMALLAETTGVFGETAAGVTLGALREALRRGQIAEGERVVMLVTGDGLKTPDPIEERYSPIEIDADADALLERLGVV
jgi:threonine synthase